MAPRAPEVDEHRLAGPERERDLLAADGVDPGKHQRGAQPGARGANSRSAQPEPPSEGTRISVSPSCGPGAVSNTPVKNSAAGIRRSPPAPLATNSASSASSTPGRSEAGSPCETDP